MKQSGKRPQSSSAKRRPKAKPRKWPRYFLIVAGSLVVVVALFVLGLTLFIQLTPFDSSKISPPTDPTIVYASDGSQYMTIAPPGTSSLPYQNIPTNLRNAIVATEDHNFWNSSSIDLRGIVRSAVVDLLTRHASQGASTIQEQLAKIVYLNDDKTISYKIKQIALGVQINQHYSKQEILAMYLNRAFLGDNCIGVQQAAWRYFGVDLTRNPNALTLNQAAILAGLPRAPSLYDPLTHPNNALRRRNQVLENMKRYGYITPEQVAQAEAQPIGVSPHSSSDGWDAHPLFTNFLFAYINDHANELQITRESLLRGGLRIYTTIAPNVQSALDRVFWNGEFDSTDFPAPINGKPVDGAAVFVNPKTGDILGAAGSRQSDYYRDGMNRAIDAYSQPGSSIKPIMEYAPAIESGNWGPYSILNNTPHDFGYGYYPHNDDPSAPGHVTLQYALEQSMNVASVWLLQQIGISTGVQFAANDGINTLTPADKQSLGIAIGGFEKGVTPLEMAQAYEAFDNQGVQVGTHLINRIVRASGDTVYQFTPTSKQVMSARTANVMTQLMEDVVQYGTGQSAKIPGWSVAGKTGTVQYDLGLGSSHPSWISRAWFDGYTSDMVGSVYLGYDIPHDPTYHLLWDSAPNHYCARIFADVVRLADAGQPPQPLSVAPSASGSSTPPANPVTQLSAAWDSVGNGIVLNWQTGIQGSPSFVITRTGPADSGLSSSNNSTPSTSSGTQTSQVGQTSGLTDEDTQVQPGVTYTYSVQAVDPTSGQNIGSPAQVTFTTPGNTPGTGNVTGPGGNTGNTDGTGNTGLGNGSTGGLGNSVNSNGTGQGGGIGTNGNNTTQTNGNGADYGAGNNTANNGTGDQGNNQGNVFNQIFGNGSGQ